MITETNLIEIATITRSCALKLANLSSNLRNQALDAIATALESVKDEILAANTADCQAAVNTIAPALYQRLKLDESKLRDAIAGVRDVAKLADPVGAVQILRQLDDGLILKRVSCPLGVLGVIFEARPDAAIQISALAIKSGNGVILKGGQEAINSCQAIVAAIKQGLSQTAVNPDVVQLLTTRDETRQLLQLDK
ncbi:MAG: gamma-glutamyl-phosphate reductase, partial [Nostocaceae cyanobacterium]|nr:gamma-glutamyl-phosphate reductase [Nostocaceae cyanobacterium]